MNRLSNKKYVWLSGDVDSEMLEQVQEILQEARGKAVHFLMNSDGGEETPGLAICDLLLLYPGTVSITVAGAAESMAAVILQAADHRYILPSSHIMLHQGETTAEGHKKNIKAFLRIADMQDDRCDELVLRRIKKKYPKYSWAKFREATDFDTYFSAEKAMEWGLVDRVIK